MFEIIYYKDKLFEFIPDDLSWISKHQTNEKKKKLIYEL